MSAGVPLAPGSFTWRLEGDRRPSIAVALRVGEAVRAAAMRAANRLGHARLPDAFHGGPGSDHAHAFWLPEDRDRDGRIDHVSVVARAGFSEGLMAVMDAVDALWLDRRATWRLVGLGPGAPDCRHLLGPARRWRAATAYVTPKHRTDPAAGCRAPLSPEGQLREEIARRGMPMPRSVAWRGAIATGGTAVAVADFVVTTRWRRAPGDAWRGAPSIEFEAPVVGPMALGFGAHFGLGLLTAES